MERLQYKIKNGPRVESINEFTLNDNTIVAMFQGFRGSYPELDFIVKYKEPTKKLRTPSHTHWIVDLLVKAEFDKEMVRDFVQKYLDLYNLIEFYLFFDILEGPMAPWAPTSFFDVLSIPRDPKRPQEPLGNRKKTQLFSKI